MNNRLCNIIYAVLAATPLALWGFSTGPPVRRAGVPSDSPLTCNACHQGTPLNSPAGSVRVEAAPYRAGQRQTIRVTVSHPEAARWGFQLTARFASDPTKKAGTFSFGGPIRLRCDDGSTNGQGSFAPAGGNCGTLLEFASHGGTPESTTGGVNGAKTFEVEWTPPDGQDLGDIVFYAAGNAANNSGNNQGDRVYTSSLRLQAENTCNYVVRPRVQGVGNSATSQGGISFNGLVSIYGANFVPSGVQRSADAGVIRDNKFPTELGCIAVEIAGQRVPVTHIQQDQLNVQVPTITQTGNVPVKVIVNPGRPGEVSVDGGTISLQSYGPAFFTFNGTSIAARHANFNVLADPAVVSGGTPARAGDIVLLYATGLADTVPNTWQAGEIVSSQSTTRAPVRVTIGGTTLPDADVMYAGLVPGSISGLYQLNVRLPATLAAGNVPVSMTVGGITSPTGTTIPVTAAVTPACSCTSESLDSLTLGARAVVGVPPANSFQAPSMDIGMRPFTFGNGTVFSNGFAEIQNRGLAGGSGHEMQVNNIVATISIGFGQTLQCVRFAFGEYGGNLNVSINNDFRNFGNFSNIHGATIGGVRVNVLSGGGGNDSGQIEFVGHMVDQASGLGQLAVGGQELWMDNICYSK